MRDMVTSPPQARDCEVAGCQKSAQKGGLYCSMHYKRRARGTNMHAPEQEKLPAQERIRAMAIAYADADSEDDGAYRRAWDNLTNAAEGWVTALLGRRGGAARAKSLTAKQRSEIARRGGLAKHEAEVRVLAGKQTGERPAGKRPRRVRQ